MPGISMDYGEDVNISPSGGIALADGDVLLRQQIIRVLATNSRQVLDDGTVLDAEYLYEPDYGASLGRRVGQAVSNANSESDPNEIENSVRQALAYVDGVSKTQPAAIEIRVVQGGVRILINPYSAATNQPIAPISLSVSS